MRYHAVTITLDFVEHLYGFCYAAVRMGDLKNVPPESMEEYKSMANHLREILVEEYGHEEMAEMDFMMERTIVDPNLIPLAKPLAELLRSKLD